MQSFFRPATWLAAGAIVALLVFGDALVASRPAGVPDHVWALVDAPVHAALAMLVLSPLLLLHRSRPAWRWLLVAALAAMALDLDHFVAARSLSLIDAVQLANRPATHSMLAAFGSAMLIYALLRDPIVSLVVLMALASHVVRDASTGATPLLWPLPAFGIPAWTYLIAELALYALAVLIAGALSSRTATGRPHQQP